MSYSSNRLQEMRKIQDIPIRIAVFQQEFERSVDEHEVTLLCCDHTFTDKICEYERICSYV
jgi:protein involved in sex pheromone biosynthesis